MNTHASRVPQSVDLTAQKNPSQRLILECDELATFIGRKDRPVWVWLALDRTTRQVVGAFVGARDRTGALGLWDHLATPYLDAVCHTDKPAAYKSVVFGELHRIGGTQHIERFNATLRARLAHLTRRLLSFARKLENLTAAVWRFIPVYNSSLP